jgi:hypothetical protein
VGRRPANANRTYGNRRYQTLAAYTNGVTLLAFLDSHDIPEDEKRRWRV